jgi:hypothetical protein
MSDYGYIQIIRVVKYLCKAGVKKSSMQAARSVAAAGLR